MACDRGHDLNAVFQGNIPPVITPAIMFVLCAGTAFAIGGGTYARALKCGCGFGPEMEDEESTIHQANEYVTFDRIRMMCEVYYDCIKELTK